MHSRGDRKAEEGECNHERCLDGKHGHCTVLVVVAAASAPEHCDKSKTHYAPIYASKQNATRAEEMAVQREEEEEKGGITPLEWKWERGLAPVAPPGPAGQGTTVRVGLAANIPSMKFTIPREKRRREGLVAAARCGEGWQKNLAVLLLIQKTAVSRTPISPLSALSPCQQLSFIFTAVWGLGYPIPTYS